MADLAPPAAPLPEGAERFVERYGEDDPRQLGEWWLPRGDSLPLVVLLHGGYWRPVYDLTLEHAVASALVARGFAVWNVDYRASDAPWPSTLLDVAAALDAVPASPVASRLDLARTAVVGHSAGGHLALWAASRGQLPADAPGAAPDVVPSLVVAQAPVADLRLAAAQGLGGGAVLALLGGTPGQVPERYSVADPAQLLPTPARVVCVHGQDDDVVPLSQSEAYAAVARAAGVEVEVQVVPGGHFEHLDPASSAMREAFDAVENRC
ncbi:MAG TPA: alpha/beta fold hydrolase [Motilibacteraceae bacterium]|nr:alpha/beta fold hydrolase [Motilibacteraceae bacterium]